MKKKKNIYLIFSYNGTIFSTVLQKFSRTKYIHVSIGIDDNLKEVYSFGRKFPEWMFPSGFTVEDFDLVTKIFKNSICQIYKLEISNSDYKKLVSELKKYIDKKNKYKYNIKGLIHIQFNKIYHRDNHFVCSQFVGKLLQDSGIYDFKKDYSVVKPKDITTIDGLEKIYEGKIINYIRMLSYEEKN